jgi:Lysylphosphatidylglycerol synthase TM region
MFKRKFRLAMLLICVGLFVLLIVKTGPTVIASRVYDVGAGFLILILISGTRHLLRTAAWYYAIERRERRIRFRDLFGIRIAGEAITDLTFLGPLLGETVKGITLSKHVTAEHSASSVVVENLAYSFSVGLFVISGLVVFLTDYPLSSSVRTGSLTALGALFLVGSLIGLILKKRYRVVSRILDRLKRLNLRWVERLHDKREKVALFEENVYSFWQAHKAASVLILLLELLSISVGVIEAWIILSLTVHRTSLFVAFMVETVNRVVNIFFAFVPMRIGVDEGGAALVLETVGYGAVEGVSLAIIRKVRTLFWIALGLVMVSRYSLSLKKNSENSDSVVTASK